MGDCPNIDCHSKVNGMHRTLFAKDGREVYFRRPSISVIIALVGLIVLPPAVTVMNIWAQQGKDPLVYASRDAAESNEKRIIKLEETASSVREDVKEIKQSMYKQQDELSEALKEMRNIVMKASRSSNNDE